MINIEKRHVEQIMWAIPDDKPQKMIIKEMGTAWKQFKTTLVRKYVKQNKSPFTKYKWLKEEKWELFKKQKTSEEFKKISEQNQKNAKKNKYPHHLGSTGYVGKIEKWDVKEDSSTQDGDVFLGIRDKRCRYWVRARVTIAPDGTVIYHDKEVEQVVERMRRLEEEVDKGTFLPDRENDILTEALGNPEHQGRTRGVGARIPWSKGFKAPRKSRSSVATGEDLEMLSQKYNHQIEQLRTEYTNQIEELKRQLRSEISQKTSVTLGIQATDNQTSPVLERSSVHSNIRMDPLDSLEKAERCKLLKLIGVEWNIVAKGMVLPSTPHATSHCEEIRDGYIRVSIDEIIDGYQQLPLPAPGRYHKTLENAQGSFVQWPKNAIILDKPKTDVPNLSNTTKTMRSDASSPKRPPLVDENVLLQLPTECKELHNIVVDKLVQGEVAFVVNMDAGLLHDDDTHIVVNFDDIADLLMLDKLDISIIQVFQMYLVKYVGKRNISVGFMDAGRISQTQFNNDTEVACNYIAESMFKHQDKKFILAPYYQFEHWILLVIVSREGMVYILDSLNQKKKEISFYYITRHFKAIFASYKSLGGQHNRRAKEIKYSIKQCPQQNDGKKCGFYVMKLMLSLVTTLFDGFPIQCLSSSPYSMEDLQQFQTIWTNFFVEKCL